MGRILVIGSSNTDMTVKGHHLPVPGETIMGGDFHMGPGGKGANQAVAARRLGGEVTFICKVGNDIFGDNSIAGYDREGIDTSHVMRSDKPSGVALILVDGNGENVISVAAGANSDITSEDMDRVADIIRSSSFLILQLEIPVPAVMRAAQIASEAGVYVILNPAPACELPRELLRHVSLMTPNQTETQILSGRAVTDEASLGEAVEEIRAMGVEDMVVTMGSRGSVVFDGDTVEFVPAEKVRAVDATAAGDTFCGALAVGLSEGLSLADAARFATKASALTVQKLGAQDSIPYRKDIQ